jgi:hypothetical protein
MTSLMLKIQEYVHCILRLGTHVSYHKNNVFGVAFEETVVGCMTSQFRVHFVLTNIGPEVFSIKGTHFVCYLGIKN